MREKQIICLLFIGLSVASHAQQTTTSQQELGRLSTGASVRAVRNQAGDWGLRVTEAGQASVVQPQPVSLELYQDSTRIRPVSVGYGSVRKTAGGFTGTAQVRADNALFTITDDWTITNDVLQVSRRVVVSGNRTGRPAAIGFLSAITFQPAQPTNRSAVDYFAPGMIYGGSAHLTRTAIGGQQAGTSVRIREDRLPAPLFGVRHQDGSSVTVLDPIPQGASTVADLYDTEAKPMVDERFRFGALGADEINRSIRFGFWWPGTEGGVTYQGNTYPGGQMARWRRRYHPLKNGLTQQYTVAFRFAKGEELAPYYTNAWRWAWATLRPKLRYHDIETVRRSLIDMLGERSVKTANGRTGIPMFVDAVTQEVPDRHQDAVMGFVGKNIEAAEFLLKDADRDTRPEGKRHRETAIAIINSFATMNMNPPVAEGFSLKTGQDGSVFSDRVYLRSLTDDFKALLRLIAYENGKGRTHADWLAWSRSFADWLLTQQQLEGGFPRSWKPGTGEVLDASPQSSYNVVPFFVLLSRVTGDVRYRQAALRAAEICWANGQDRGVFVGGTIDNPDVIDKEAGTLSVEAYLALLEDTKDPKWLNRAQQAANFAETWIYLWDVPVPADTDARRLHWKAGIPTTGLQLISSGHSLVDVYMTFDVDEYAALSKLTGDAHYEDVARLLLHNTKSMLALPGRTFDLAGPGWQQEHFSLAPRRGMGLHRGWLPWVTTSHLNGIFSLEALDPALFKKLSQPETLKAEK